MPILKISIQLSLWNILNKDKQIGLGKLYKPKLCDSNECIFCPFAYKIFLIKVNKGIVLN